VLFVLSAHALDRMQMRKISHDDIMYVIEKHDFSSPGHNGDTMLVRKFPDGRELKVWIVGPLPLSERVIIKSVAWRSGF
jgi:hypothetical protein